MIDERRDLIRKWLREKGYHRDDISSGLAFYDSYDGRKPSDKAILGICENSHKLAIESSIKKISKDQPILIKYINRTSLWPVILSAIFGSISGFIIVDNLREIKLCLLVMMQYLW